MKKVIPPEFQGVQGLAGEAVPLRVSCVMESPPIIYDLPHLDGILAAAMVRAAYHSSLIPGLQDDEAPEIPIPLQVLWRDSRGFPLYACTPLSPVGEAVQDIVYYHKRKQPGRWTVRSRNGNPWSAQATAGRWMDRQVPRPTIINPEWTCTCLGDPDQIRSLLASVSSVGKKRTSGNGAVLHWDVQPAEAFSLHDGQRLLTNVPVQAVKEAALLDVALEEHITLGAWTAPRWNNKLYLPVHPAGTKVKHAR